MRETSTDAHKVNRETGTARERQAVALAALRRGPCTAKELDERAGTDGLWKRLSELKRQGLALEDGVRQCTVTGRLALTWRAVPEGETPTEKVRRPHRRTWFLAVMAGGCVFGGTVRQDVVDAAGREPWPTAEVIEVREVRKQRS